MPNTKATYRVLIAAGGTGGHVYPAIAIADALKASWPETEITFVGTKDHMEWTNPLWISVALPQKCG